MASADGTLVAVVIATGVNVYGASSKGKDPIIPIVGGFVVGAFLLAVAGSAPELAELFAAAFAITSLTANGQPLINAVTQITSSNNRPAANGQGPTVTNLHDTVNNLN